MALQVEDYQKYKVMVKNKGSICTYGSDDPWYPNTLKEIDLWLLMSLREMKTVTEMKACGRKKRNEEGQIIWGPDKKPVYEEYQAEVTNKVTTGRLLPNFEVDPKSLEAVKKLAPVEILRSYGWDKPQDRKIQPPEAASEPKLETTEKAEV